MLHINSVGPGYLESFNVPSTDDAIDPWTSFTADDLNDAPDGVVFLDSGAPPANSPAGGELDGQVATITKIVPFGDPLVDVAWRIQSAECVAFDGTVARSFLREQWQGDWTPWVEIGADTHFDANGYLNMANKGITWILDPTDPQDAATKSYVDGRHVALSQADYDALPTKDPNVLYLITS